MRVTPFHIDIPDGVLADLAVRLDRARLADEVVPSVPGYGFSDRPATTGTRFRPSSLVPALNDSPAGLAAWILEEPHLFAADLREVFRPLLSAAAPPTERR